MSEAVLLPRADLNVDLVRWGGPIRRAIQEVFSGPVLEAADRMDAFIEEQPDLVREAAYARPVDEIPYSVHNLPPNLFDHCGGEPFIPDSDTSLERFMDAFWPAHLQLHSSVPGFHAHATRPEFRDHLTENLQKRRESGADIEADDWSRYQDAYTDQLNRGFYTLGHNAAAMNLPEILPFAKSAGILDAAIGRHRSYLLSNLSSPHRIGLYLRMPIGPYGVAFSERVLRAAGFMCDFIDQDQELRVHLGDKTNQHLDTVVHHTTRGKSNRKLGQGVIYGNKDSTIVATQEGIISQTAAISLMTSEIIEGYEDPEKLLMTLGEHDMINRLTLLLVLGVAGSVAAGGIYFKGLLKDKDPTAFSTEALDDLKSLRAVFMRAAHQKWLHHKAIASEKGQDVANQEAPQVTLGLPCPMAGPYKPSAGETKVPGAVSRLTPTFQRVFTCIATRPESARVAPAPWDGPRLFSGGRFLTPKDA